MSAEAAVEVPVAVSARTFLTHFAIHNVPPPHYYPFLTNADVYFILNTFQVPAVEEPVAGKCTL